MSSVNAFKNLQGQWSLARSITSPKGSSIANATGTALFTVVNNSQNLLKYSESGTVTYDKQEPLKFSREYFYDVTEESMSVFFDCDLTSLYHTLNFSEVTRGVGEHFCSPDTYTTTYTFHFPESYITSCEVKGPKKDYTIETDYSRVMEPSSSL